MSKVLIFVPFAFLALAACAPVDRGFGETVRLNNVRQTIHPEGIEPSPGAPIEGGSGARADAAIERYEKGSVAQPVQQSSRSAGGGSGGGSSQ